MARGCRTREDEKVPSRRRSSSRDCLGSRFGSSFRGLTRSCPRSQRIVLWTPARDDHVHQGLQIDDLERRELPLLRRELDGEGLALSVPKTPVQHSASLRIVKTSDLEERECRRFRRHIRMRSQLDHAAPHADTDREEHDPEMPTLGQA